MEIERPGTLPKEPEVYMYGECKHCRCKVRKVTPSEVVDYRPGVIPTIACLTEGCDHVIYLEKTIMR